MVCQHQDTIALLEVGDEAKKNYLDQSKKVSNAFLMQGIDIANDCDLKYKSSKNQRLLVELALMKLASIDFDGQKKKSERLGISDFLIPASFFKGQGNTNPIQKNKEVIKSIDTNPSNKVADSSTAQKPLADLEESATEVLVAEPPIEINSPSNEEPSENRNNPKPAINIQSKRVSGLSLSSLKAKKEHELNRKDDTIDESQLPKDAFTEEQMQAHWADFVQIIDKDGRKILASNLNTDIPKLKNETTIWIELPNGTMKKEVEREQYDLMEYLRQKLNNHFISLTITVNEETAKKFAFTPLEKYEKLREKNPAIDILRKEFDLDF